MYKNKISAFKKKIWLSSPTIHKEEVEYINTAIKTNWVSTVGENVNVVEVISTKKCNMKYAVALSSCTAALHLAIRLAAEKIYGKPKIGEGTLFNRKVFCSDMTFTATVNPIIYEGGTPIFIDTNINTWNMDPECLEKAFKLYPDIKIVVYAELYGFPNDVSEIKKICNHHGAILIEDCAEALGASFEGKPCGSFGNYSAISFNGNKIITGSSGGCFLTNSLEDANIVRKWSTQARDNASWYEHSEIGYNYRMSNIIAGIIRGQYGHLNEHIKKKKEIYLRYKKGLKDLPITLNPIIKGSKPNYWLTALIIDKKHMAYQNRNETTAKYKQEINKSSPTEIIEALSSINVDSRPIWKPMHLQPIFKKCNFIGKNGLLRKDDFSVGEDIFNRGCCLPSDIKMSNKEQDYIIKLIRKCFD